MAAELSWVWMWPLLALTVGPLTHGGLKFRLSKPRVDSSTQYAYKKKLSLSMISLPRSKEGIDIHFFPLICQLSK